MLSTVIQKLSDAASKGHGPPVHVPYRSYKITRILQNSFGGNACSMIICNVTPASCFSEESHNTLRFASRAKCVLTVPVYQVTNSRLKPNASNWRGAWCHRCERLA